jgi:hypothetical protein
MQHYEQVNLLKVKMTYIVDSFCFITDDYIVKKD